MDINALQMLFEEIIELFCVIDDGLNFQGYFPLSLFQNFCDLADKTLQLLEYLK